MCVCPLANRLLLLPATASRLALTDMPDADRAASGRQWQQQQRQQQRQQRWLWQRLRRVSNRFARYCFHCVRYLYFLVLLLFVHTHTHVHTYVPRCRYVCGSAHVNTFASIYCTFLCLFYTRSKCSLALRSLSSALLNHLTRFLRPLQIRPTNPQTVWLGLCTLLSLPLSFPLSPPVSLCSSGQFPFRQFGT